MMSGGHKVDVRGVIPNYKYVRNKPQSGLLYWSTEYSGTTL